MTAHGSRRGAGVYGLPAHGVAVVYDGACPLCSAYVRAIRIKAAAGDLALIDARQRPDIAAQMKADGIDLDEAYVCSVDGVLYAGGDAVNVLALLSGPSTAFNRFNRVVFGSPAVARRLYPLLRAVRNGLLRVRGVGRINAPPR